MRKLTALILLLHSDAEAGRAPRPLPRKANFFIVMAIFFLLRLSAYTIRKCSAPLSIFDSRQMMTRPSTPAPALATWHVMSAASAAAAASAYINNALQTSARLVDNIQCMAINE